MLPRPRIAGDPRLASHVTFGANCKAAFAWAAAPRPPPLEGAASPGAALMAPTMRHVPASRGRSAISRLRRDRQDAKGAAAERDALVDTLNGARDLMSETPKWRICVVLLGDDVDAVLSSARSGRA